MASVSNTRSSDSYDAEWANVQERHERNLAKQKEDEESALAEAKAEYQQKLKDLRQEANENVRKLKEDTYDSHGRRFANMEREHLEEKHRITNAYQTSLNKEEQNRQEQVRLYEAKVDQALSEANERTTSQVKTQKNEFVKLAEAKREEADQAKKYYESEIAKERVKSQKSTEQIVKENSVETEKAMSVNNEKVREYLQENRNRNQEALAEKDQELNELKNNADPNKVAPEARRKIEDVYNKRFEKQVSEERKSNAANLAAMRNQNQDVQQKVRDQYSQKFNELNKDLREKYNVEKQVLVSGYRDLEAHSETLQKNLQDKQSNQALRTSQKQALEMDLQERRNQERLTAQRENMVEERHNDQMESESKQRNVEREMGYKLSDIRRDYEKKIVDIKDEHEREKQYSKFEFDKKYQEQQRESKRILDDRIKAYEAQLKQQEVVHKERDRLLTEHYEEELDKMKRTNARITQAKS
jgi:hypothetical protein